MFLNRKIWGCCLIFLFGIQPVLPQTNNSSPQSNVINVSQLLNDVKILSTDEMQGRFVGTPGGVKAREYVVKRFQEVGLKSFNDSFTQPFGLLSRSEKKIEGANVVGYLKGRKNADKYLVITAHYDHLGVYQGQIFNGADDNASGTSALFAMAQYFRQHPPQNSLIFVAFDAEEAGLQGARKFVDQLPVKKEQILLNINMDMISRNKANELFVSGTRHYPSLKPYLESIAKGSSIKLRLGHDQPEPPRDDWTNQSDHYAFHQAKIPFLYFGVEDHQDYHRPTDDFENIDQTFYVHAVETILSAIKLLDVNL